MSNRSLHLLVRLAELGGRRRVVAALLVLPVLPALLFVVAHLAPPLSAEGDLASLELGTLHAADGVQLVGPYSRYGWSHPGPLFFYLALPFYEILGRSVSGLAVAAALINGAATSAAVVIASRAAAQGGAAATAWIALSFGFLWTIFGSLAADGAGMVPFSGKESYAVLRVARAEADAVLVAGDANDEYVVACSIDGATFGVEKRVEPRDAVGVVPGIILWPEVGRCASLRVAARGGDGLYSVGEVSLVKVGPR